MNQPLHRRFVLRSLTGSLATTLALPGLSSLRASDVGTGGVVQPQRGAGAGARRFVAVGNLLGFQTKQLFPEKIGKDFEDTTLLRPLASNRDRISVYRGLD